MDGYLKEDPKIASFYRLLFQHLMLIHFWEISVFSQKSFILMWPWQIPFQCLYSQEKDRKAQEMQLLVISKYTDTITTRQSSSIVKLEPGPNTQTHLYLYLGTRKENWRCQLTFLTIILSISYLNNLNSQSLCIYFWISFQFN